MINFRFKNSFKYNLGENNMIIHPVQMPYIPNQVIKPPVIQFKETVAAMPSSQKPVSVAYADNSYIMSFLVKNKLKINLDGVDAAKIGQEGLNLDEELVKNNALLQNSIERLVKDKDTKGQWLKWIDLPEAQLKKAAEIQNFVDSSVKNKFDDAVILGIGGSSLGAKAIIGALSDSEWNSMTKEQRNGYPRIHFIENIDPDHFSEVMNKLDLNKTIAVTVSKSGKTPETSAVYLNVRDRFKEASKKGLIPAEELKNHFVIIADKNPEKSLLTKEAVQKGYKTFEVPDDVCGRFSLFSDSGLVPAAMVGINIQELLKGAADMTKTTVNTKNIKDNLAASQALVHYLEYQKGKEYNVFVPYTDKLANFNDWYTKLWVESLARKESKDGKIITSNYYPIRGMGALDQHSQLQGWRDGNNDKVYTFITVKNFNNNVPIAKNSEDVQDALGYMRNHSMNELIDKESKTAMQILSKNNRPVMNIELPKMNAYNLGQLMQMMMFQTAIVGELQGLGINTYTQPAVDEIVKEIKTNMESGN
jgi:glucose-6-phosphate isomerase